MGGWFVREGGVSRELTLIVAPLEVLMRPDFIGGMMVPLVLLVTALHSSQVVPVQSVRVRFWSLVKRAGSWKVGLMWRAPSWMKTFSVPVVVCSNSPLLGCWSAEDHRYLEDLEV